MVQVISSMDFVGFTSMETRLTNYACGKRDELVPLLICVKDYDTDAW